MTNTLHRQGELESLKHDYIIFVHTAKGKNREGSAEKNREFMRICQKYHPVNMGDVKQGSVLHDDIAFESLLATMEDGTVAAAVFTDIDTLQKVVEELIRADLGLCINISGLLDVMSTAAEYNSDPAIAKKLLTYHAFANAKENAGQERALTVAAFAANKVEPAQFRTILAKVHKQEAYFDSFADSANGQEKAALKSVFDGEAAQDVQRMRAAMIRMSERPKEG
ncbi:MAG: nitrate- and nitrite sensing domain-containing protein, partial [Syntrophales bacterium]|nr:nitrate- and nitrite sensing domain-containing protein [Syntrophales bacterium]